MSLEAMIWALKVNSAPDPLAKLVLIGLANHADSEGRDARPKQETLAVYASCTVRSVRRKLAELEAPEVGLIHRGDQRGVAHLRADRRPIVWDVALCTGGHAVLPSGGERGDTLSPRNESRGDTPVHHGGTLLSDRTVLEPLPPLPPRSCRRHVAAPDAACRRCRDDQRALVEAEADAQRLRDLQQMTEEAWAVVAACLLCDDRGYTPAGGRCTHVANQAEIARQGAARARAALRVR